VPNATEKVKDVTEIHTNCEINMEGISYSQLSDYMQIVYMQNFIL